MPTTAKLYLGSTQIGGEPPAIDPELPIAPNNADGSFTVSGTLVQDFTASGTFTPSPGVTKVNLVLVGGGAPGITSVGGLNSDESSRGGGSGGQVLVFLNYPISAPVSVVVGAASSSTSFGPLVALGGQSPFYTRDGGRSSMPLAIGDGGTPTGAFDSRPRAGSNGTVVNGVYYGGGGGAGFRGNPSGNPAGGLGGGGRGAHFNSSSGVGAAALSGTNGTGGGGGGGTTSQATAGAGGSGRVLVFVE